MKQIPLTQGKVTLVDDDDFEKLNKHKWHAMRSPLSGGLNPDTFYAVRKIRTPLGGRQLRMHRFITGANAGEQVDHIDSNGLNNQKANLRKCDVQQNAANKRHANSNGFKGIAFLKRPLAKPWLAHIKFNGRLMHIGYYKTKIEAASAYDQKAIELFGAFAKLNIV